MTQLFSNNLDTALAAALSDVATSATLSDGSGLNAPTGGDHEMVTLIAAGNVEIVKVTARSANVITIVRAQEGTTARAWATGTRVFAGVTAGTLAATADAIVNQSPKVEKSIAGGESSASDIRSTALGFEATAVFPGADPILGGRAVAVGDRSAASAYQSVAIGSLANSSGTQGVAVGEFATATGNESIAIGEFASTEDFPSGVPADSVGAIAIGAECAARGTESIAIGKFSFVEGEAAIGIGESCTAEGLQSIAIGQWSYADAEGAIALGYTSATTPNTFAIGSLHAVPNSSAVFGASQTNAAWTMSGASAVIMSGALDLKTLQTYTIPIPTGVTFFPDEVGVIITAAAGVTGQPTLRFGITGTEAKYLTATATTGLEAVHDRERFATLLSAAGAKTLRAEVTAGATGTTLTGRIYWRGTAMVD